MFRNYDYKLLSTYRTQLMGVAILWVAFFHTTIDVTHIPILSQIKKTGYGGVDIFLLLSGLGIYHAYQKNDNALYFYKRRLARILPTYLPIVFIFCTILWLSKQMSFNSLIMNMTTLSFWFNSINRFDWYVPAIATLYLITPMFMFFFNKKNKYITIAAAILVSFLISAFIITTPHNYLLILTTRIPIFLIGILIGYFININKKVTSFQSIVYALILIIGILMLHIILVYFSSNQLWKYGLWWYPFILITVPLCMSISILLQHINNKLNTLSFLTFCGSHSLEIYLFHERILILSKFIMANATIIKYNFLYNLVCFAISLFLAFCWKKLVNMCFSKFKYISK